MKKKEIRQLSKYQLKEKLVELRKDLMKLNSQRYSKTVPENPGNLKNIRRNIARILTFIKQKTKSEVNFKKK